jgi:hypothetical protein
MPAYAAPGAYFELADQAPEGISAIRTDIAALVGLAERGRLDAPTRVESWEQFHAVFGGFVPYGYLAYAVKAFFENGGRTCYVTRVAAPEVAVASVPEVAGADRASTEVAGGAGAFVPGAAVTLRQGTAVAVVAVGSVDEPAGRVHWVAPFGDALDPSLPMTLATGAGAASTVLHDTTGLPSLLVEASSPGTWGNGLAVRAGRSHPAATSTAARAQPPDGTALYVDSVVGFEACTLVRIVQPGATGLSVHHRFVAAADPARNVVVWDEPLAGGFDPAAGASLETLEFAVSVTERGRHREAASGLSLHPDHPRFAGGPLEDLRLVTLALAHPWLGVPGAGEAAARLPAAGPAQALAGGRDGLAGLRVEDFTGDAASAVRRGVAALEPVDEVAIVAVPDINIRPAPPVERAPLPEPEPDPCCPGPEPEPAAVALPSPSVTEQPPTFQHDEIHRVQQALVEHCEALRNRVAVLDAPFALDTGEVTSWRRRFDTSWAALYYPWVAVLDPLQRGVAPVRFVPPSGHVAGVYALGDQTVGVHRAPANLGLRWAQDTDVAVDAPTQAGLNPIGVNCLRGVEARGLQVYGARTLASDPALRYVNVRRLLAMIASSLLASVQWAVFEPHDEQLRLLLRLATTSFLRGLWQAGALAGSRPEDAFFVRCDETTNPPEVVAAGQLSCDIGVAPSLPAEFVVVRIGRADNEWMVLQ